MKTSFHVQCKFPYSLLKRTIWIYPLFFALHTSAKNSFSQTVLPPIPQEVAEEIKTVVPPQGQESGPQAPKTPSKEEEYEEAVKDLKKHEGPFTFYIRNREILLELPEENIGKLWQIQANIETGVGVASEQGIFQAGMPIGNELFEWVKNNDQIWLVRPNIKYRWSKDNPLGLASQKEFARPILAGFKIEQTHPAKKLFLVNVTSLFTGEVFSLSKEVNDTFGPGYFFDQAKFSIEAINEFPKNTRILTIVPFFNPSPTGGLLNQFNMNAEEFSARETLEDPKSIPLALSFNLWYSEPSSYMPRHADPRVGHFTVDFLNVDEFNKRDHMSHYITRFHLKKKDPKAKLSDPAKPIIFTIDPSIPEKYRETVRKAILRWNPAFEAIGFKNVIQVQDAPNDPEWSHTDNRYNVIRWVISPNTALGVGIPLADLRTGEIIRSTISIDANWVRYLELGYEYLIDPALPAGATQAHKMLAKPEEFLNWQSKMLGYDPLLNHSPFVQRILKRTPEAHTCQHSKLQSHSALFAWQTLQSSLQPGQKPKVNKEEFVDQYLMDVVSHETGHALGLRHNFLGSKFLSTEQLADDKVIKQLGSTASVMDYVPFNIQAALKNGQYYATPKIGVYDMWAIKYAYTEIAAGRPEDEKFELDKIASECNKHGLAFMTDTDLVGPNPYVVLYDNATDPIQYASKVVLAAERIKQYAIKNLPKLGKSYDERTTAILNSLRQTFAQALMVWKFAGGIDTNRNFHGDPGQKPTMKPIDPALQKQAMELVTKHILSMDSLNLPENVMENLSINPHWNRYNTWDAPLRKIIGGGQIMITLAFLQESTIGRILENQYKLEKSKNVYSLRDHYSLLFNAIFEEIGKNKQIVSTRRDLQKEAFTILLVQAGVGIGLEPVWFYKVNEDVRVLASEWIRTLEQRVHEQLVHHKGLDAITISHLRDLQRRIKLYHDRKAVVNPFS